MTAFFNISVWITLAMVIPGLVSMATLFGAMVVGDTCSLLPAASAVKEFSDWAVAGVAVTIMIMTQAVGILLESFLVDHKWLGPEKIAIDIPKGVDPLGQRAITLEPYAEYQGLYLLLAELRNDEDSHGHLQRALAQFFLSNNTMVSFAVGIVGTLWHVVIAPAQVLGAQFAYLFLLTACLVVTVKVVRVRFVVMTKALWAARRRRLVEAKKKAESAGRG